MLTQSNTSKKTKLSKSDINNDKPDVNRGIEFILNGGKNKRKKPFHIIFDQIVCLFNKEIDIYFEFSLNLRNKK